MEVDEMDGNARRYLVTQLSWRELLYRVRFKWEDSKNGGWGVWMWV
jgi:hypothetical protein